MNPKAPKKAKNRKSDRMSEMFSELLNRTNTVQLDEVDPSLQGLAIITDGQWELAASPDTIEVIWVAFATDGNVLRRIPFAKISIGRDSKGCPVKVSARHDAEEPIESEVIELEWFKEAANPLYTSICACIDRALN
jgi:hypothetical protein